MAHLVSCQIGSLCLRLGQRGLLLIVVDIFPDYISGMRSIMARSGVAPALLVDTVNGTPLHRLPCKCLASGESLLTRVEILPLHDYVIPQRPEVAPHRFVDAFVLQVREDGPDM